jgi:A/G-specific adenine glycosylase
MSDCTLILMLQAKKTRGYEKYGFWQVLCKRNEQYHIFYSISSSPEKPLLMQRLPNNRPMIIPEDQKKALQKKLRTWFRKNKRSMPWRETSDPYKIWISEIMLQQTQVSTVEEYYKRFIGCFPDVHELARASVHDLMKVWEGLGYYSRARNLHLASKKIVGEFAGKIPDDPETLLGLPGIGQYTAGAILSIAYGKRCPALDGNVIRVFARLFHVTDNVDQPGTRRMLWSLAGQVLPQKEIRSFNEALMELGALVCKPRNPDCPSCPVLSICEARRLGIEESLPFRTPRKPVPHVQVTAAVIWKKDRFLITLRPPRGLLGGLWEFPGGKKESGESLEECLIREIREELNIRIQIRSRLVSVNHAYTHFKITLHAFECDYKEGSLRPDPESVTDYKWITMSELDQFAFPGADRKVIDTVRKKYNRRLA